MSITLGPASNENSIYSLVRRKCKVDPTNPDSYTSDSIITAYANEELQTIASDCRSVKISNVGTEPLTVQGQRMYPLPDNCLELVDVYLGPANAQIRMQQASTEFLYQNFGPGYMNRQGQPFYYYIDYNATTNQYQIAFAMVPSVTGQLITMFYVLKPNTLVVGEDSGVTQMDERLDWALVYGVAAKIMHDKRDPAFEQIYDGKRSEFVQKYLDSGRKSREPLNMLSQYRGYQSYEI